MLSDTEVWHDADWGEVCDVGPTSTLGSSGAFGSRVEAETARSALWARGIESRLVGHDGGGLGVSLSLDGLGVSLSLDHQGMAVHVPEDELEFARETLDMCDDPGAGNPMGKLGTVLAGAVIVLVAVLVAVGVVR